MSENDANDEHTSENDEALTFSPELVIKAYAMGCFPMADSREGEINWYRPDPRAVLPLNDFHISKSLARRVRSGRFTITSDLAFKEVIQSCALPRIASTHFDDEGQTWINQDIIHVYTQLNEAGLTHSIEAWLPVDMAEAACLKLNLNPKDSIVKEINHVPMQLAGGLYGLALGSGFFGESMFSRATDASRVCLVHLVEHLKKLQFTLLDTQIINPHMSQFGVIEIPDHVYETQLHDALSRIIAWEAFCVPGKSVAEDAIHKK